MSEEVKKEDLAATAGKTKEETTEPKEEKEGADFSFDSTVEELPEEIKQKLELLEGYKSFPREKLICAFFDSAEYQDLKKDNRSFVLDLFHGILGREPEDSELNSKIAALVENNDSSMMAWGMIGSQEYKKKMKKCP